MQDYQPCARTCKDIEYEREKFMDERTDNYALRSELDATRRMCVTIQESHKATLAELSLPKKQRDLLADVAQKVHCMNCPIYAEGMGCAEVQEGSCYEHLLQWSEHKAEEAENG